jgi:hypothetical protein
MQRSHHHPNVCCQLPAINDWRGVHGLMGDTGAPLLLHPKEYEVTLFLDEPAEG